MKSRFNLQFFGGIFGGSTKTDVQRIARRDPEPEELTNLRTELYKKIAPSLDAFDVNSWQRANTTTQNALAQQDNLLGQIPSSLSRSSGLVDELANIARTGNIPSTLTDAMNASVNSNLQSGMGTMLNNLAQRGVLNSSVTSTGTNQLAQAAADAYNKNYLTAYQSVLSGLGSGLQGAQSNTASLLSALGALGNVPQQTYNALGAQLQTPYSFWKDWQNFYQNDDPYNTIVTQKQSSPRCITGDTLVTLADGREIPVSELKNEDDIRAWDFENGLIASAPLTGFFKSTPEGGADVIRVEFEDGSNVGVIREHLFFDMTEGKFIAINSDSQEYVGHEFAKVNANGEVMPVKVKSIRYDGKATETYGPQCSGYLNYLAGGFITGNDGQLGLCNQFEYDVERMTYDAAKKAEDLEKYGLLSYDDFEGVVSKEFFEHNHFEEFAVAIGKGLLTLEQIRGYFGQFAEFMLE